MQENKRKPIWPQTAQPELSFKQPSKITNAKLNLSHISSIGSSTPSSVPFVVERIPQGRHKKKRKRCIKHRKKYKEETSTDKEMHRSEENMEKVLYYEDMY